MLPYAKLLSCPGLPLEKVKWSYFLINFQGKWASYPPDKLHPWHPAPTVPRQPGSSPGEMGSAVKIPKDREDEKREKFKINQVRFPYDI